MRELLEGSHVFPGEYIIKVFGPADDGFRDAVAAVASSVFGPRVQIRERLSRQGNKLALTLKAHAFDADEVMAAYEKLQSVAGVKMIL